MAIIAISRGSFSGGSILAGCLARKLGYPELGREGVLRSAERYGIPVSEMTAAMEQPPSIQERLFGPRLRYAKFVRAAICESVRDGNLIYHGHAGHLLMPDLPNVVRVRVIADMDYRISAVMSTQGIGADEAASYIKKVDHQREQWGRFLYGVDWRDPALYDLVVNIQRMGIEGACELVTHTAMLHAYRATPETVRLTEDALLGSRVWATLACNPQTSYADVEVKARDGLVTITGATHFRPVAQAIPRVAATVPGVHQVRDQVRDTSASYP